ncbi:MAG TPA: YMGG-like glycine zipper-containing protein [Pyrinomonadaceae bacterium]|jgi:hypothetical protein
MRKYIAMLVMLVLVVGIMPLAMPTSVEAQTYVQRYRDRNGRIRYRRVAKPSYYRRHRNRINMAIGTGGGAILGGLIGGKRGALIGAGVGAGGSALYTYKLKPKKRKYRKIRRY